MRGIYVTVDGLSGSGKGTIIKWLNDHLVGLGRKVAVLETRRLDPLRDTGAKILPWCKKNGLNRQSFLLPLFAAGSLISDRAIKAAREENEVVLSDRSWITNLAYTAGSTHLSQVQIWDLYANRIGLMIPDLAVIVDCDPGVAMERANKRKTHVDMGLGGKMSGDLEHQSRIRKEFLAIPTLFSQSLNVALVSNSGAYSDDEGVLRERLSKVGREIIASAELQGVRL